MVEFSFSVYGRGPAGGKGFAFWYTKDLKAPTVSTDFFGHQGNFEGVAIVFDTADPLNNRVNPFIYAYDIFSNKSVENHGTKNAADFANYASPSVHLGACFREYRNTPESVFAKISYSNNILSLDIDIRQKGLSYTNCFKTHINLPSGYHFGISAQTSHDGVGIDVAHLILDDHDIYSFETYELNPAAKGKKYRPGEQADIASGKEFKMDDKMKEVLTLH